jgi:hypothetical protein
VVERHDLRHLFVEQTVEGDARAVVGQLAIGSSLDPAVRPQLA